MTDYQQKVWERSQRGFTAPQIARELGKSPGSVRGTLSQMRKREPILRQQLTTVSVKWTEDLLERVIREIRGERDRLSEALEAIS